MAEFVLRYEDQLGLIVLNGSGRLQINQVLFAHGSDREQ
jgi:hypothetical protein